MCRKVFLGVLLLLGCELMDAATTPSPPSPELEARIYQKDNVHRVWWDKGGFSKNDFACYEGVRPSADWNVLGQTGQGDFDPLKRPVYVFKDLYKEGALAIPFGFTRIWDDRGSVMNEDGSVWRVKCGPGWVPLGDFFYPANRIDSPGTDLYWKAACVREDLTVPCKPGAKIWDDSRSFAWNDVSTWASLGPENTLSGFVHANNVHEHPPNITFNCLKTSAFKIVQD